MISNWKNNILWNLNNWIDKKNDQYYNEGIEISEESSNNTLNQLTENFVKLNNEINELDVILNNNLYKLQLLMLWEKWKWIDYSTHVASDDLSIREQSIIVHHLIENRDMLYSKLQFILDDIRKLMSQLSWINENNIQESSLNKRISDLKEKL